MPLYATPDELAVYMHPDTEDPQPPADATVLLRTASGLVASAIASARYATDGDDLPTDPRKRDAVRDATMEQASAWAIHGLDPRKGAAQVERRVSSKSIGPASWSYESGSAADAAMDALASGERLTSAALGILDAAGLLSGRLTVSRAVERFPIHTVPYNPLTGELAHG